MAEDLHQNKPETISDPDKLAKLRTEALEEAPTTEAAVDSTPTPSKAPDAEAARDVINAQTSTSEQAVSTNDETGATETPKAKVEDNGIPKDQLPLWKKVLGRNTGTLAYYDGKYYKPTGIKRADPSEKLIKTIWKSITGR